MMSAPVETTGSTAVTPPLRKAKVLLLTHRLPYPPDRGDRIRAYHLLKALSQKFDMALACVSEEPVWLQHHHLLRAMAKRVALQPMIKPWSALRAGGAFLRGQPITPAWHYRLGLAEQIVQWHEQDPFDLVLTFCTGMIDYARLLTRQRNTAGQRIKHILDVVDVDSLKWSAYARQSWPPMSWVYGSEAKRLRRIEAGELDPIDAVTVISKAEARAYEQSVGHHEGLTVVRNGVDLEYFAPLQDPNNHTMVFVGVLNYRPNAEAVTWFAKQVMPPLREKVPDAHLYIVGRHPTPAVSALSQIPGVEVVGSVPDVRSYLMQSSVSIAPLLLARGTQNKVLEAMACQRAVVCSPAAAAGIDATADEHFLVADSPADWVVQLMRLFGDQPLRQKIAAAARTHVQAHYSWANAMAPMVQLVDRLTQQNVTPPPPAV